MKLLTKLYKELFFDKNDIFDKKFTYFFIIIILTIIILYNFFV